MFCKCATDVVWFINYILFRIYPNQRQKIKIVVHGLMIYLFSFFFYLSDHVEHFKQKFVLNHWVHVISLTCRSNFVKGKYIPRLVTLNHITVIIWLLIFFLTLRFFNFSLIYIYFFKKNLFSNLNFILFHR